jgi:copper homeostasis protein
MIVEVIATSVTEAIDAGQNGADRIELVSALNEGGLTPSYGLIKEVITSVDIPVNVMVRPHSQSFSYDKGDLLTMIEDIKVIRELGAAGIVIGVLTADNTIDMEALKKLLSVSGDLDVTFHRAFDVVANQEEALKTIFEFKQINRVLTSGGEESVLNATSQIKKLVTVTKNSSCSILPGAGLTVDALYDFVLNTGVNEVHFGNGVRYNGENKAAIDKDKLQQIQMIKQKIRDAHNNFS